MKFKSTPILISLTSTLLFGGLHYPVYSANGIQLAQAQVNQNKKPKLSIEDIRKQVEMRLGNVWSKLPGLTNGVATFDFTIKQDGSLARLTPIKSSSNPNFDKAAMGTIKRVIPLPNLPDHLEVVAINLRATFRSTPQRSVQLGFAPLNFGSQPPQQAQKQVVQKPPIKKAPPPKQNKRAPIPVARQAKQLPQKQQTRKAQPPKQQSRSQQKPPVQQKRPDYKPIGIIAKPNQRFNPGRPPNMNRAQLDQQLYSLVNLGVVAMNGGDYKTAIVKLEQAYALDRNYQAGKKNLSIALNNYGLSMKSQPQKAIRVFHRAMVVDPQNPKARANLDALITIMGKNPSSFTDRQALGDAALKSGDRDGAKIEYMAALNIKNDPGIRAKLNTLMQGGNPNNAGNVRPPQKNPVKKPAPKQPVPKKTIPQQKRPVKANSTSKPKAKPKPVQKKKPITVKKPVKKAPGGNKINSKLNTVYSRLGNLERKLFGKTFAGDDIIQRLSRLEKKAFGSVQSGSAKRRLDALLLAI